MVYLHASSHLFHKCCTINLKESSFLNLPFRAQHDIRPHSKKILVLGLFKIKCVHIKSKKLTKEIPYKTKLYRFVLLCYIRNRRQQSHVLFSLRKFFRLKTVNEIFFFNNPLQWYVKKCFKQTNFNIRESFLRHL